MARTKIEVEISTAQEISLMERYGRKCSRETLVRRAIAEVLLQQAEDVPIFTSRKDAEAQLAAKAESARLAAEAEKPSAEVQALLVRFGNGEKLVDLDGREVSALAIPDKQPGDEPSALPLIAQFGGDNSEWYPVGVEEILSLQESTQPAPKTGVPKLECGNACGWTGDEPTAEKKCPECGWYVRDFVPQESEVGAGA